MKPGYLIEVSDPQQSRVVLYPSYYADYVALSYVWGINQTYKLTTSTLQTKCNRLDASKLPQTIIDAFKVTRSLGYNYLWIDALCIIQDDPEDTNRELAKMGAIYHNSVITIVAANAPSSSSGFLKHTLAPEFVIEPFSLPFPSSSNNVTLAYRSSYIPSKDPINSRAWTLQERILSTRCLIFSNSGLKWSCDTYWHDLGAPPDSPLFPRLLNRWSKFSNGLRD